MMDSLPEDVTMRTLFKGIIAEEAPQSLVRTGRRRYSLRKSIGDRMKLTDVSMQQSPHMILRSQMKANVQQSLKKIAATAGSSVERSTRKNSSALRKTKRLEAFPKENLDNYTPKILLKKFMQSELESSLIRVSNFKMKKPVEKKSQTKTKVQSNSDSFNLSSPAKDTVEQNLPANRKIQPKLDNTTESQENEKVELSEKSLRPPDISTIVGLISSDFEESTTKPILCRRPKKRKIINEDDFEEGVHNYLEQNKEPEENEIERSGPFEKTAGLTDISGMVGSLNFGTDESVSGPVLSRKPRRLKLINEEDFEGGVLFYLHQIKEKQLAEVQEATRNDTGKEKSTTNVQQDERGIDELHTSHHQTLNDGMEAVSITNEEMRNELGLDTGLDIEKQVELVSSDKEKLVKTPFAGKDKTPRLVEQRILTETDPQMVFRIERLREDRCEGDKPPGHELEKLKDTKQNLLLESPTLHCSEGIVVDDMDDKTVEEHVVNVRRTEDGETVGILTNTERMDYAEETGVGVEDAEVVGERMGDVKADEIIQRAKMKRMESLGFDSEGSSPPALDGKGSGPLELDGEGSGPPRLDGEGSSPTELEGKGSGLAGLDGEGSGPLELDGEGSGPLELDGEGSGPPRLDGEGSSPTELEGKGSGLAGLDGEGSGPLELDGEGSCPPGLDGEGSCLTELDGKGSGLAGLDGEGSGPLELDGEGSGPPRLDGEGSSPTELEGKGSGLAGLDGEGSGPLELDGEGSGPLELDGEGSCPPGLDGEGSCLTELDGKGSGPLELDSEGSGPPRLDGEESNTPELDGEGSGPPELDGEGSGPPKLDGEGSGPPGLDGEGTNTPELDGEGSGPPELDGEGSGPPGQDGEGTNTPELDGEGSGLAGLDGEGSNTPELDSEESGPPELDGEGSGLAGLDSEGLAVGETDSEKVEETDSDGDMESDEIDEEENDSKEVRWTLQLNEKALKSSPLLTTPHFLKILGRQARKPLTKVNANPKRTTRERKKTTLPSSFVKSVFTHYAKMKVKKETFTAVDRCLELYFKQLCADMDAYSKHAKRRTIEKEDLELLMERQGFVTAKMPLNVLIENHLPMECREKLIPMAVSGSKTIPKR